MNLAMISVFFTIKNVAIGILLSWLLILPCNANSGSPRLVVLGIAQDAGYPQSGCYQAHCLPGWKDKSLRKMPVSLAVYDPRTHSKLLFEATPAFPQQWYQLEQLANDSQYSLDGIFLTHAHIGHYAGLMFLGHESMGAMDVPVYVMPRMSRFLQQNGPWSQLVKFNNIRLKSLRAQRTEKIQRLSVTPFLVPHRDEFSETVGYKIAGPDRSLVFIPDINKWQDWSTDLNKLVRSVDYAFLDAAFFADGELPGRDMSKIPHPFVSETMALLKDMPREERKKVWFIHMNHTNPLLFEDSEQSQVVQQAGFNVAYEGQQLSL